MMGGRIAEEIIFGDITAGASSDIQRATELARKMVIEWGMSEKLGFMSFGSNSEVFIGRDYQVQNKYSDATAKIIDDEVKSILDSNYKRAKDLLLDKKDLLDRMSRLLLEEETIYAEEVDELIAGKDEQEIIARLRDKIEKRKEKEETIRKEQELIKQEKMQELKIKTAEALKDAGVIGEVEFNKLKEEYEKAKAEKDSFLQNRDYQLKESAEKKLAEKKELEKSNDSVASLDKSEEVAEVKPKTVKKSSSAKKSTTKKSSTATSTTKTTAKKTTKATSKPKQSNTDSTDENK